MPIFDQGYQRWSGELSGLRWRWYVIARHGVRVGMQNRFVRLVLLVALLPAAALALFLSIWGLIEQKSELVAPLMPLLSFLDPQILADPKSYRVEFWTLCYDYFLLTEQRFSMILILLIGPQLISQDLRFNALPLYFSRPLRRIDYFLGKLGVIGAFLGLVLIVPTLVAYVLGMLFSLDITIIRDTFPLLVSCLLYGAIMVVSAGTLILAMSALSRNSRYVALCWLALWFLGSFVGLVLNEADAEERRQTYHQRVWEQGQTQPPQAGPLTPQQKSSLYQEQREAHLKAEREFQAEQLRLARSNWRWLVSYTANLQRMGSSLLGTDACWEKLSRHQPEGYRAQFLKERMGPQHPWYWSAGVLAVLFGISVGILNLRVRSLDRLR